MMEGMSSDAEDGLFSSDEESEHNVENFVLCSFAHHACSPLLQGFLHDEGLCKVALACHFSFGCDLSVSGLSGSPSLELSLWHSAASFLTMQRCRVATAVRGCEPWCCIDMWSEFAHFCCVLSLLPSRMGCKNMERGVMGDMCRYHG